MSQRIVVAADGAELVGERWPGKAPSAVFLHAGVADRRSWHGVADALVGAVTVIAYDRRGFGESKPSASPFSHLADLTALLGVVGDEPVWLIGSSMGGRLALDAALATPERVAGLVLIAPAVGGAPEPLLDEATQHLGDLIDDALALGDLEWVNRLETWLWLDGPASPEGRVGGHVRQLALEMNQIVLAASAEEEDAGVDDSDSWGRLHEIRTPTLVLCGDLDAPFMLDQSREVAARIPNARCGIIAGAAHQPQLEQPQRVAELVTEAIAMPATNRDSAVPAH